MSSQDSLLTRIALGSRPRRRVDLDGRAVADLHASILKCLQRLVSTRAGASKALPDYGLPELDPTADGFSSQVSDFSRRLTATIEHYEPRLRDVLVTENRAGSSDRAQDLFTLKLDVKGRVSIPGSRHKLRLVASISADGRVNVTSS